MRIFNGYNNQRIQRPDKGLRKIIILGLILVGIFVVVWALYFFAKVNLPFSSDDIPVNFTIEKGNSTKTVANKLRDENVINNPFIFILNAVLNNAGDKLQAGDYVLNQNMSIADILDNFTAGKVIRDERTITIIEGWSNRQIADHLEIIGAFTKEEFNQALDLNYEFEHQEATKFKYEGFLFPDTYIIAKTAEASDLIQKMLTNFETKVDQEVENLSEVIILASIVEKEVGRNKEKITDTDRKEMQTEREVVAGVFYNRLDIGQKLESDATVNYVTGKKDRRPLISDTKVDSLYNTYQNKGLPPGPIGSPGLGAIEAVINPAKTDYYFFINKIDGEAVFGKTLQDHLENVAKYLDNQ
jgi:UPF0755 protein